MINFMDNTLPQVRLLDHALQVMTYNDIVFQVMAVIDSDPNMDGATKNAVRAMAFFIGSSPIHSRSAGAILAAVQSLGWEAIGVKDAPPLEGSERGGIIEVILGVCAVTITSRAMDALALAEAGSSLPDDWNDQPALASAVDSETL